MVSSSLPGSSKRRRNTRGGIDRGGFLTGPQNLCVEGASVDAIRCSTRLILSLVRPRQRSDRCSLIVLGNGTCVRAFTSCRALRAHSFHGICPTEKFPDRSYSLRWVKRVDKIAQLFTSRSHTTRFQSKFANSNRNFGLIHSCQSQECLASRHGGQLPLFWHWRCCMRVQHDSAVPASRMH